MNDICIHSRGEPDTVCASDGSLTLIIPIQIKRRGKRKSVTLPSGVSPCPGVTEEIRTPIQRALVRGHRWLAMLGSGEVRSLTELATREGVDRAYVSRMVNLTTLAPDIVAMILEETLPAHVTLMDLASGTPLLWEEQRTLITKTDRE